MVRPGIFIQYNTTVVYYIDQWVRREWSPDSCVWGGGGISSGRDGFY